MEPDGSHALSNSAEAKTSKWAFFISFKRTFSGTRPQEKSASMPRRCRRRFYLPLTEPICYPKAMVRSLKGIFARVFHTVSAAIINTAASARCKDVLALGGLFRAKGTLLMKARVHGYEISGLGVLVCVLL